MNDANLKTFISFIMLTQTELFKDFPEPMQNFISELEKNKWVLNRIYGSINSVLIYEYGNTSPVKNKVIIRYEPSKPSPFTAFFEQPKLSYVEEIEYLKSTTQWE